MISNAPAIFRTGFDNGASNEFGGTPEGQWVAENAHRFGFILRFTKDGEPITGYIYEPWHYRYVGVQAAAYIRSHDLTLEEYCCYYAGGNSDAPA